MRRCGPFFAARLQAPTCEEVHAELSFQFVYELSDTMKKPSVLNSLQQDR